MTFTSIRFPWTGLQNKCQSKARLWYKHVKVDLSSFSSTKTLSLRLKNKWKDGSQKTHRNERWDKDAGMKERLRIVTSTRQHKKSSMHGRENNNHENKTRRNYDLKGKGGGRLKLCNVDGDVPLCMRSFDEENKDSSSSSKKNQRRDGERKQRFRQQEE